jgi:hypothetical protein
MPRAGSMQRVILLVGILALLMVTINQTVLAEEKPNAEASTVMGSWQELEPGLELGTFAAPQASDVEDSLIRVLRIDPTRFEFRLLNASAAGEPKLLSAKQWCNQNGLVAAINPSMYQEDLRTSVSLMRSKTHTNNAWLSKDNAILAFDRKVSYVPLIKIIDRQCENFDFWKDKYDTLIQSIRMISCRGKNVWSQQPKKWSTAAIATDYDDNVLFIHVPSAHSTHDLINMLLALPLRISRAMYTEGGPEAQLYVRSGQAEFEFTGLISTGFSDAVDLGYALQVPNVIGIARRSEPLQ